MRRARPIAAARAAALLIGAVLLTVAGCGGSSDAGSGAGAPAVKGMDETTALLKGVEQHGLALGDPKAPITLVQVIDLQCPFCRAHELDTQPRVINDLVRTGRVRLQLVPVAFLGPDSQRMEVVLLRLAKTNRAWDFTNLVYWNQGKEGSGYATDAWLRRIVSAIPGTEPTLASTTPDAPIANAAQLSAAVAQRSVAKVGGGGTPFFTIGATGHPLDDLTPILAGAPPNAYDTILKAVDALEAGKAPEPLAKHVQATTPESRGA